MVVCFERETQSGSAESDAGDDGPPKAPIPLSRYVARHILSEPITLFTAILALLTWRLIAVGRDQHKAAMASIAVAKAGVGVASLGGAATNKAADAAAKSADIAEKTLHATQRAYVAVRPASSINVQMLPPQFAPYDSQVVSMTFWMIMENQGNTPAAEMINMCGAAFLVKSDGVLFDYELSVSTVKQGNSAIIGPHSDIITPKETFSVQHMNLIMKGEAELILSGWVEYDDVIEGTPRHGIEWCFKVSIAGQLVPGQCETRFDVYGDHNRYYDCPPSASRTVWEEA